MSSRRGLLSNAPPSAQRPRGSARPDKSRTENSRSSGPHHPPALPPYEAPACPLDQTARRALNELSGNAAETRRYAAELQISVKMLGEAVSEVNDRYVERRARLKRKLESVEAAGDPEAAAAVDEETRALRDSVREMAREVPELTARCDEGVRQVIDWGVELGDGRAALASAVQEVDEESREAERRVARARERRERIREAREMRMENGEMPEDQEDEEEEEEGEEDEDDIQITGPLQRLRDNKRKLLSDYEGKSLYQRYGLNNDYINFKKLWHLALQPPGAEEKPLPDATRWFDGRNDDSDDEEDEDEDVVVAGEVRSLRCPLSQVMMTEPYTNRDGCKHTFEKAAIFEYLGNKPGRRGMCPQTGCGKEVALNDFSLDQYVLRQIKRAQRQNDGEDDEEDEEDMEDEEGQDESMLVTSQRNIKKERRRRDDMDDDED